MLASIGLSHPVKASATHYELVAEIERITGIHERFSTGLSFVNAESCDEEISRMNLVYSNLQLFGVMPAHSFQFSCDVVRSSIQLSSP